MAMKHANVCPSCGGDTRPVSYAIKCGRDDMDFDFYDEHVETNSECNVKDGPNQGVFYKYHD